MPDDDGDHEVGAEHHEVVDFADIKVKRGGMNRKSQSSALSVAR